MPVNLRTIDAPPRSESRAVIVGPAAAPPRRAARPADDSAQPLRDLQDPVEEPVRPEVKVDWSNPARQPPGQTPTGQTPPAYERKDSGGSAGGPRKCCAGTAGALERGSRSSRGGALTEGDE